MLQAGHHLGLGLEAAHKFGPVGKAGQNNFDGHLASDRGLVGPIDGAKPAGPNPILQFIPWRYLAWQMLSNGHLPLWNPLSGMGAPLLAFITIAGMPTVIGEGSYTMIASNLSGAINGPKKLADKENDAKLSPNRKPPPCPLGTNGTRNTRAPR